MNSRYPSVRYTAKFTVSFVIICVYGAEWLVYHIACKPAMYPAVVFNMCFFLAVWSFLVAAFTDPGSLACPEWQAWLKSRAQEQAQREQRGEGAGAGPVTRRGWSAGEVTWCQCCQQERPERAHHCSQCGICVLRRDHHCPWLGNCVGWRNHKAFLLANWWSFCTCLAFLLTMNKPTAREAAAVAFGTPDRAPNATEAVALVGAFMAFTAAVCTGGVWMNSLFMLTRNITAIEAYFSGPNPYASPDNCFNLQQTLGNIDKFLLLPLPPNRAPPASGSALCNGVSFPSFPIHEKKRCIAEADEAGGSATGSTTTYCTC